MSVGLIVDSQIKKYGAEVTHTLDGKSHKTRAFVQPLRYRNKIYIGGEYHNLGYMRKEKYLYIGCRDCPLTENRSVICSGSGKFLVKRCELYRVGEEAVYVWALLVPCGEPREDEYD